MILGLLHLAWIHLYVIIKNALLSGVYGAIHFPLGVYRTAIRLSSPSQSKGRASYERYRRMVTEHTKSMINKNLWPFVVLFMYVPALGKLQDFGYALAPKVYPTDFFVGLYTPFIFLCERVVRICNIFMIGDVGYQTLGARMQRSLIYRIQDTIFCIYHALVYDGMSFSISLAIGMMFPKLGWWFYFISCCLMNGMFAFDFKYTNKGIPYADKVSFATENWPYFLAFGVYSTLPDLLSDRLLSTLFYIIMYHLSVVCCNEVIAPRYDSIPSAPNLILSCWICDTIAAPFAPDQETIKMERQKKVEELMEQFKHP